MSLSLLLSHHPSVFAPSSVFRRERREEEEEEVKRREKGASLQSGFLSFERSKLHQADVEVCFSCHSARLLPNEMLHTDSCLRAPGDKTVVTE